MLNVKKIYIPYTREMISIMSDSEEFLNIIISLYRPFVQERYEAGTNSISISVLFSDEIIKIEVGETRSYYELSRRYFLGQVISIITKCITTSQGWNIYHGAAVELNNKVFMFLGDSGAGKTTLTAYLTLLGNGKYISEDMLIVDCLRKQIVPCNNELHMRRGGMELLWDKYGKDIFSSKFVKCEEYERYFVTPPSVIKEIKTIDAVFCLDRKDNRSLSKYEKITNGIFERLLGACFLPNNTIENVKGSLALTNLIDMYSLSYYDFEDVYQLLCSY